MTEFKVGDRVRCISVAYEDRSCMLNKVGTIKDPNVGDGTAGVAFDDDVNGHTLGGRCKDGHGWWMCPGQLKKVTDTTKVIIYTQGRTVTAKLLREKECIAQAVAKCSPDDDFDVLVGAQIALQRLVEQQGSKFVLNTKMFKDIEVL